MLHRTYSKSAQHILTCAQRLQGGGVERAMLRMAEGWLRAGRRVTLVIRIELLAMLILPLLASLMAHGIGMTGN